MSNLIPTTEQIRSICTTGYYALDDEKEFDRWLQQHDAEVAKATEERIIKLLEEERERHIPWCGDTQPCPKCNYTMGLETAIALIEGEHK